MLQALKSYSPNEALDVEDVIARFPTLSKAHRDYSRTRETYQHIPTAPTLRALTADGFRIHGVQVQNVRPGREPGYQKHLLRLRLPGLDEVAPGTVPELYLRNAHDGTSAYFLAAGMFRGVCFNGMVIGSTWGYIKVFHSGKGTSEKVTAAANKIVDSFGVLSRRVNVWRGIELSTDEQYAFAEQAAGLRFGSEAKVNVRSLIEVRRDEDRAPDLWSVFNRTQESLLQGGAISNGRRSRGVGAIDRSLNLNMSLYNLAEAWARKEPPRVAELAAFAEAA